MLGLDLSDARQQLDGMEVRRRLAEVHVAPDVLRSRLDELAAETRAARQRSQGAAAAPPRLRGQGHAATPYYSVQHHFPSVYGINAHGVPAAAGPARQAQARQLKAYLLLFEQLLANGQAQVDHLRDLLSAHRPSQSYWWQALDETSVPGMDALFWQPEDIEQQVYRPLDDHAMRKSRALDHLLGLYGEAFPEHSLRQFSGHLDPAQVDATLLGYKVALVKDLVKFGRDRAGGFDYSQPIDGSDDNRSGLQRRVGLLLGFPERRTPWLCARPSNSASEDQARSAAALVYALGPGEGWTRLPAVPSDTPTPDQRSDSVALPDLHQSDVTLLRAAAHPNRYWWDPGSAGHGRVLVDLGDGRCWHLADVAGPDAAARHAGRMRQAALAHDRSSEGMHVVEHLLLSTGASTDAADLTVVFAAWSVRCQHPGFRQLAQETVELNCPAQLRPRCLWLERPAMRQFEMLWGRWLEQKRIHCLGAPAEHAALDQAGAALAAWLRVAHDSRAEPPP